MIIVPILCVSEFFRNFPMFSMNDNTKSFNWLGEEYKVAKYLPVDISFIVVEFTQKIILYDMME